MMHPTPASSLEPPWVNHMLPSGPSTMLAGELGAGNSLTSPAGLTRPIVYGAFGSVNHMLPSGPAAMLWGRPLPSERTGARFTFGVDDADRVRAGLGEPQGVVGSRRDVLAARPIRASVPSSFPGGSVYSSISLGFVGLMRSILLVLFSTSVNHRFSCSGPAVMPPTAVLGSGCVLTMASLTGGSRKSSDSVADGLMSPIPPPAVNQRLSSGPSAMPFVPLPSNAVLSSDVSAHPTPIGMVPSLNRVTAPKQPLGVAVYHRSPSAPAATARGLLPSFRKYGVTSAAAVETPTPTSIATRLAISANCLDRTLTTPVSSRSSPNLSRWTASRSSIGWASWWLAGRFHPGGR